MTASEDVQLYLSAKSEYDDACARVAEIGQYLFRLGNALMRKPSSPIGTPAFRSGEWPTADQMIQMLQRVDKAAVAALEKFDALSRELQETVNPPGIPRR